MKKQKEIKTLQINPVCNCNYSRLTSMKNEWIIKDIMWSNGETFMNVAHSRMGLTHSIRLNHIIFGGELKKGDLVVFIKAIETKNTNNEDEERPTKDGDDSPIHIDGSDMNICLNSVDIQKEAKLYRSIELAVDFNSLSAVLISLAKIHTTQNIEVTHNSLGADDSYCVKFTTEI